MTKPHNIHVDDIPNEELGATPKVTIKCSCGFETHTLLAVGMPTAVNHIRNIHQEGRVHYKDLTRAIDINGKSRPVIGNVRVSAFNRKSVI